MATQYDPEKHVEEKVSDTSSDVPRDNGSIYAREELVDPDKDETLHRGLSARQISMIAVSWPPALVCFVYSICVLYSLEVQLVQV